MEKFDLVPTAKATPKFGGIVNRRPGDLKPWRYNPRTHSDKQKAKLKASIRKFGFTSVVVIDEHLGILSGHSRTEVAIELGLETIPTLVLYGFSEAQKAAFAISDNKLALLSGWDLPALRIVLEEIQIQDEYAIELTGYDTAEFDVICGGTETSDAHDPDDLQVADVVAEVVSRVGDHWILGRHRLLCANALLPESYAILMRGDLAEMVVADPPFNVKISGHVCGNGAIQHKEFVMASGEMTAEEFTFFLTTAFRRAAEFSIDGSIHFQFMDWRHLKEALAAGTAVYTELKNICVWDKGSGGMGSLYRSQSEFILVFKNGTAPHVNNVELGKHGRYRTNVWKYPGRDRELLKIHPTAKTVGLVSDVLRDCSRRNGIVVDNFAGSGTILMAAERTGRQARAIELDPQYVDIAVMRWRRVTGKSAVLATTGQTWEEVRAERLGDKDREAGHEL